MPRLFKKKTERAAEQSPPSDVGDTTIDSQDGNNHGYSVHSEEHAAPSPRTPEADIRRWQVDYSPPQPAMQYDKRQEAMPMQSRYPNYGSQPFVTNAGGRRVLQAEGFDYINWRPYGQRRRRRNEGSFEQQCKALAPYVRTIVVSACQGLEEQRWAGEVGPPGALGTMPGPYVGSKSSLRNI